MSHLSIYIYHPSLPAPGLSSGTRDRHRVRLAHRLSSWGPKAWLLCDTWTLGSLTRNHTPIPCIARQTLDCWTTREVPSLLEEEARWVPGAGGLWGAALEPSGWGGAGAGAPWPGGSLEPGAELQCGPGRFPLLSFSLAQGRSKGSLSHTFRDPCSASGKIPAPASWSPKGPGSGAQL